MVARTNLMAAAVARKQATASASPELVQTSSSKNQQQEVGQPNQQQQPAQSVRRGVFSPGHVKRMAQARNGVNNNTVTATAALYGGSIHNNPPVLKSNRSGSSSSIPKCVAKAATLSSWSKGSEKVGSSDKYGIPSNKSSGTTSSPTRHARNTHTSTAGSPTNMYTEAPKNTKISPKQRVRAASSTPPLPSLLSQDSDTAHTPTQHTHDVEYSIVDSGLYNKFQDAFGMTLRNNPGILPGAPTVIESIKSAMFNVQQSKAQNEAEMRKQLGKIKAEKDQVEAQLRKEMGSTAMHKNELTKELGAAKQEQDILQDSLTKQKSAVEAIKRDLKTQMNNVTNEKEELTQHLGFLSKSRAELEKVLESEMIQVEKDRDALEKVVAERKKLQRQKAENKELEGKIDRMTNSASKEKKALQAEVADLKKFEGHIQQLKNQNEASRINLEKEQMQLKEIVDVMQTKKSALMESRSELEAQYQKEIDDLESQIESTKMMHSNDMEMLIKNRVMSYLRRSNCGEGGEGCMEAPAIECIGMMNGGSSGGTSNGSFDVESLIKSRVEAELQAKMKVIEDQRKHEEELRQRQDEELRQKQEEDMRRLEFEAEQRRRLDELESQQVEKEKTARRYQKKKQHREREDDQSLMESQSMFSSDESYVSMKARSRLKQSKSKEAQMKKEIDTLRDEIELVKVRNKKSESEAMRDEIMMSLRTPRISSTNPFGGQPQPRQHDDPDIREEIRCLRDEIKKGIHTQTPVQTTPAGRFMSYHSSSSPVEDTREDIRQNLQSLRDEVRMSHHSTPPQRRFTSPTETRLSPAYSHEGVDTHTRSYPMRDRGVRDVRPSEEDFIPERPKSQAARVGRPSSFLLDQDEERTRLSRHSPAPPQTARARRNRYEEERDSPPAPPETARARRSLPRYDDEQFDDDAGLNTRSSVSLRRRGRGSFRDDYEDDAVDRMYLASPPLKEERYPRPTGRSRYYL